MSDHATHLLSSSPFPASHDLLAELLPHLVAWMRAQRWYAAKAADPTDVRVLGTAEIAATDTHLVLDAVLRVGGGSRAADYQVPLLISRPGPDDARRADGAAEIAVLAVPGGPLRVEDATRTDVGRAALLSVVTGARTMSGEGVALEGDPAPGTAAPRIASSRLLSGEQSNSSMIFELEGAGPVIAKLFRVLQPGENPDVVVQGALAAAGSTQVAPYLGAARITWGQDDRAAAAGGAESGHALFVQTFFPGVEDAWRVALRDAAGGIDFSAGSRALGEATARVHRDLALHMPTVEPSAAERERLVASMLGRLEEAGGEVPEVAAASPRLSAVIRGALEVPWPAFQRVHGDYHLGQVLAVPQQGWVLLDFEGEPMRPLAERALPDCPVRDVAGMLRSLDYVAGAVRLEHGLDASDWARAARSAFLDGYAGVAGVRPDDEAFTVLLAAFEADKAVYEALYEARNRPDWAPIPLGALERLAA